MSFLYVKEMPLILVTDNPYLDSIIYRATSLYSRSPKEGLLHEEAASFLAKDAPSDCQSPYHKPIYVAEVVKPQLYTAKPLLWTVVCSDDALMKQLLGDFFRSEYSCHWLFQKYLFLGHDLP